MLTVSRNLRHHKRFVATLSNKALLSNVASSGNIIVQPNALRADIKFDTLVEMFVQTTKINGDNKVFGTRVGDKFDWISYNEFAREVQKFRNVLAAHDFGYDDKIAVIANNR